MHRDVNVIETIPIPLPRQRILARLGYNRHLTSMPRRHAELIESAIRFGFALCRLRGAWRRIPIAQRDASGFCLATGQRIESASLASLLSMRGRSSGSLAEGAMHLPIMKQLVQSLGTSPATWLIACACVQFIHDWG